MAIFGKNCPHYKGMWCICRQLAYLDNKSDYFTAQYCREIKWAIIINCRHFFDQ